MKLIGKIVFFLLILGFNLGMIFMNMEFAVWIIFFQMGYYAFFYYLYFDKIGVKSEVEE